MKQPGLTLPELYKHSYIGGLDELRGIAILVVLIGHFNEGFWHSGLIGKLTQNGGLGVHLFFVISGFLITTLLFKEKIKEGNISIRKFYLRRLIRIFPVAYLYLLLILVCNVIFHLAIPGSFFLFTFLYLSNIGRLFKNLDLYPNTILIEHYWSLAVEEQFYLTYPFLVKKMARQLPFIIILALLGINICKLALPRPYFFYNYEGILIGSGLALLTFKYGISRKFIPMAFPVVLGLFILIIALSLKSWLLSDLVIDLLFAFILLIVIQAENGKKSSATIVSNRVLRYIGVISYSLYIWQQIFTLKSGLKSTFPMLNNILLAALLLVLAAVSSYHLYEKPFLKMKKRFSVIR